MKVISFSFDTDLTSISLEENPFEADWSAPPKKTSKNPFENPFEFGATDEATPEGGNPFEDEPDLKEENEAKKLSNPFQTSSDNFPKEAPSKTSSTNNVQNSQELGSGVTPKDSEKKIGSLTFGQKSLTKKPVVVQKMGN